MLAIPKAHSQHQARCTLRMRDQLNNRLNCLWNCPKFSQELFRLHQIAPSHRPAHDMGQQIAWGRGFFGEALLADTTQLQQITSLVPSDRKEAALFGLAAAALTTSPLSTLLSIGGASSARTSGFAQIATLFNAQLALWEPDPLLIAKFLYEVELNALQRTLNLNIYPTFFFSRTRDRVHTSKSSSLRAYLQARGRCSAPVQLDHSQGTCRDLIAQAGFVWIEPKGASLRICSRLLPKLAKEAIVVLRFSEKDPEKVWQRLVRLCRAAQRIPCALPSGQVCTLKSIECAVGAAWVALVPAAQLPCVEV